MDALVAHSQAMVDNGEDASMLLSMLSVEVAESSAGLATHLYELPTGFDRKNIDVSIAFEDGRTCGVTIESQ